MPEAEETAPDTVGGFLGQSGVTLSLTQIRVDEWVMVWSLHLLMCVLEKTEDSRHSYPWRQAHLKP